MPKTSIEWCDYSWPVVNGCRRISAGCGTGRAGGCYAERLAATRLKHTDRYRGLAVMTDKGPQWTGETRLIEKELAMPLRLRKPSRIFVADMGDLFFEGVPFEVIDRVFAVMLVADRHTYQVLTKRPVRMREYLAADRRVSIYAAACAMLASPPTIEQLFAELPWWLGTSVEDQKTADERIPELLAARSSPLFGQVAWVSYEPALGPVHFARRWLVPQHLPSWGRNSNGERGCDTCCNGDRCDQPRHVDRRSCTACGGSGFLPDRGLDWIVVGGESGPRARPFDLPWARSVITQCRAAKVPVFVKQLGADVRTRNDDNFTIDEDPPDDDFPGWPTHLVAEDRVEPVGRDVYQGAPVRVRLRDRKGGDMAEWRSDLRVRQFPEVRS